MLNKQHLMKWFNTTYYFTNNGKIGVNGKQNTYKTPEVIAQTYWSACNNLCLDTDWQIAECVKVIESFRPNKDSNTDDFSVEEFIKQYIIMNKDKHWRINSAMTELEYSYGPHAASAPADIDDLLTSIKAENIKAGSPFKSEDIKTILQNIAFNAKHKALEEVTNKIKFDKNYIKYTEDFLHGIYDYLKPTESYEIFSMLFKHWAWQVKRKFNNLPVVYHIWLNFCGATNLGKSTMIKKICSPMADFLSTTQIAKVFDDTKEIKRLTEKYILNFDELAVNNIDGGESGLQTDQIAMLKSLLTGDKLDARIYGSQNQATKRITFSCISSANYHLYDIIYDETSMRRFFEFHCMADKPESYDIINKWIDNSLDFWKGIDENLDNGYWDVFSEIGKQINAIQCAYYPTKSTLMYWLEYNTIKKGKNKPSQIYPQYREWCKENGYKAKTLIAFINELKKRFPEFISPDGVLSVEITPKDATVNEPVDTFFANLTKKEVVEDFDDN